MYILLQEYIIHTNDVCYVSLSVWVIYSQVDMITEQIAYPNFIKIDQDLDNFYADVSCLVQQICLHSCKWISDSHISLRCHSAFLLQLHISEEVEYFTAVSAMREFAIKKMISNYFYPTDKTK